MRNEALQKEFVPEEELAQPVEDEMERLRDYLTRRIFDTPPRFEGRREDQSSMGGALVGAIDAKINRSEPPLEMQRIMIEGGKSVALIGKNGSGKSTFFDGVMEQRNADFSSGSHGYREGVHGKKI